MPEMVIRKLNRDEIGEAAYRLTPYAFAPTPPLPPKEDFIEGITERSGRIYYAALENGLAQAIAGSHAMSENVRGKLYPTSGLFAVASHPSARRRGLARRVIAALLAEVHEAGCAFSLLYPFRESFYERLGYVPFPQPRFVKFSPASLEPLLRQDLGGWVEMALNSENQPAYLDFIRRLQRSRHGMSVFDSSPLINYSRMERWTALAKSAGETVGAMVYTLQGEVIGQFTMHIEYFYYSQPRGRYLLLEWIARHMNQATAVELWLTPDEFPETWCPDLEYTLGDLSKPPMGRVLDISNIGGMQTGPGKFTALISDPFCPWNKGIWSFETAHGTLTVQPGGEAQCGLSIQALSALVYGVNDPAEFAFRGWGEPQAELQAVMRSMFPRLTPYIHERF